MSLCGKGYVPGMCRALTPSQLPLPQPYPLPHWAESWGPNTVNLNKTEELGLSLEYPILFTKCYWDWSWAGSVWVAPSSPVVKGIGAHRGMATPQGAVMLSGEVKMI